MTSNKYKHMGKTVGYSYMETWNNRFDITHWVVLKLLFYFMLLIYI